MSKIAKFLLIFSAPHFYAGSGETVEIPCDAIAALGPKKCWVTRTKCCGSQDIQYGLTFEDPKDSNAIVGYFITVDGKGVVVDLVSEANLVAYCNDCCDGTATLDRNATYAASGFPDFAESNTSSFCITRADDGSSYAQNQMAMDYLDKVTTITLFSATGTSSKYNVKAFKKPTPIGADTVASGVCS